MCVYVYVYVIYYNAIIYYGRRPRSAANESGSPIQLGFSNAKKAERFNCKNEDHVM